MSNRDVATLSSLRETSKSSSSPQMYRKPNVLKEKFKKEKKRYSANSFFLIPPKNKIQFHPVKTTPTLQNKPSQCSRESFVVFFLFKKQFLKETALNSPSMKELLRRWSLLPGIEKNSFTLSPQQIHCICQKTYQENNNFMVGCDTCFKWYHTKGIDFDDGLTDIADYFYCTSCIEKKFKPMLNYWCYMQQKKISYQCNGY